MGRLVEVKVGEGIGHIRLNRPDKLNALSKELVAQVIEALDLLEQDPEVKAVLLSGEGKAFCAGGDIAAMKELGNAYEVAQWIEYVSGLSRKIMDMDKYVIAAVHGYAAGAGFSIALAADFIIAEKEAKFALSFTNIGLIPDLGLIKLLTERVPPPLAKEWISSGRILSAQELADKGIVNQLTEEPVAEEAKRFTSFIVNGPSISNKYVKYLVNHVNELPKEAAFMQENMIQAMLLQTEDHKEGITAFFEKRAPQFTGK